MTSGPSTAPATGTGSPRRSPWIRFRRSCDRSPRRPVHSLLIVLHRLLGRQRLRLRRQGYQYRIDGGAWSPVSSGTANTFSGLADGNHTVQVRVFDNAGNNGTASITVMTDATVADHHHHRSGGPVQHRQAHRLLQLDRERRHERHPRLPVSPGRERVVRMTTSTGTVLTSVPDGHHILMVMAYDRAGNTATAMVNFTTDSYPPAISIVSINVSGPVNDRTVVFGWTGSDLNSGVAGYQYRLDGLDWSALSMNLTTTYQHLSEGYHTSACGRTIRPATSPPIPTRSTSGDRAGLRHHLARMVSMHQTGDVTPTWACTGPIDLQSYSTQMDSGPGPPSD